MAGSNDGALDLDRYVIDLDPTGRAVPSPSPTGPPVHVEGYTIGAPLLTHEPPHAGEMHPDGDEILYLVSGRLVVVLEDDTPPREVQLAPGQAVVVPRGVWHRVKLLEPSRIVHITPGPGGEHRPLEPADADPASTS